MTADRRAEPEDRKPHAGDDFFERIVNTGQVLIVGLDPAGRVVFFNRRCEVVTGVSRREALGSEWLERFVPPRAREEVRRAMGEVLSGGREGSYRFPLVGADGKERLIEWDTSAVRGEDLKVQMLLGKGVDVTERVRAEERFQRAVQASPVALVMVERSGRVSLASAHAERLFGYPPGELAGAMVESLIPERFRSGHPTLRDRFLRSPAARAMGQGRDLYGLRKDGTEVPIEIGLTPVEIDEGTMVLATIIDITGRKMAEQALQEREALLRSMMDNSPAVIYLKDTQGRYIMVNRQYSELFRVGNDAIKGKTDHDLFPAELADRYRENDQRVIGERRPMQFEEEAPHGAERHVYLSVKFPLFTSAGEVYGMCGISTDITDQRRMERDLAHAEKLTALGQLAAGVAHEINTPLTNILLVAESLMRRASDPVIKTKLETIVTQVETSSRIVKGLLDFARKKEPAFGRVDLAQTVRDTILFIQGKAPSDVEFLVEAPSEPVEVEGDRSQLTQVFANIALNAIEAMGGRGRVTFRVSKESIREEEGPARDHGVVVIEDEGPGISEVVKERIFEPFFTTKGERGGTGLGLSVVYGIVRAHHGSIEASNRREGGARFRIVLPFARPAEAGAAA